jgi:hypothetical protein
MAVEARNRLSQVVGKRLPASILFDHRTLRNLARFIAGNEMGAAFVPTGPDIPGSVPVNVLSLAEERTLAILRSDTDQPEEVRNMHFCVRLRGPLDVAALKRAMEAVAQRHESLRTVFKIEGDRVVPRVMPAADVIGRSLKLASLSDPAQPEAELAAEIRVPFDLQHGPLTRAMLYPIGPDEHILLVVGHHLIIDGWSAGILVSELDLFYRAARAGEAPPGLVAPVQYRTFARWQRGRLASNEMEEHRRYWATYLANPPPITDFPVDRPRPHRRTYSGRRIRFAFGMERHAALWAFCRSEDVSPFMAMVAGYGALLSRQTGATDLWIGTNVAGRTQSWQLGILGDFSNTLPLRLNLSNDPTCRELLRHTRKIVANALDHQEYPMMLLNRELSLGFDVARAALPPGIQYDNFPFRFALPNLRIDPIELPFDINQPNFLTRIIEASGELWGRIEYNTDLYDEATVARVWSSLLSVFDSILRDPERRVSKL